MSNEVRPITSALGLFHFMEFLEKDLEEIIYTSERGGINGVIFQRHFGYSLKNEGFNI